MTNKNKKIASLVLAGSIVVGVPVVAHANTIENENQTISETQERTKSYYMIKEGDTLGQIAAAVYGDFSCYEELQILNDIEDANQIYVGQYIELPLTKADLLYAVSDKINNMYSYYVVEKSDTMSQICEKFFQDGTWNAACKLTTFNQDIIVNPNEIYVGQVLRIPTKEGFNRIVPNDYSKYYKVYESTDNKKKKHFKHNHNHKHDEMPPIFIGPDGEKECDGPVKGLRK